MRRGAAAGRIGIDPTAPAPEVPMLHMQHAQLSLLFMERSRPKKLEFPSEDREHQRQLERVRDSLLRRGELPIAEPQGI
jgi:hypothetical protein